MHVAHFVLLGFVLFTSANQREERMDWADFRFSLQRPIAWHSIEFIDLARNRCRCRVEPGQIEEMLSQNECRPFVTVAKYGAGTAKANPALTVFHCPEVVGNALSAARKHFDEITSEDGFVRVLVRPQEAKIAGLPAATFSTLHLVENDSGPPYEMTSTFWIVQRTADGFMILASSPPSGEDSAETEFKRIVESIVAG